MSELFLRSLGIESALKSARTLDDFLSRCEGLRKRSRTRHGHWIARTFIQPVDPTIWKIQRKTDKDGRRNWACAVYHRHSAIHFYIGKYLHILNQPPWWLPSQNYENGVLEHRLDLKSSDSEANPSAKVEQPVDWEHVQAQFGQRLYCIASWLIHARLEPNIFETHHPWWSTTILSKASFYHMPGLLQNRWNEFTEPPPIILKIVLIVCILMQVSLNNLKDVSFGTHPSEAVLYHDKV